jgi:indole-3-glycerol phosphate synthase
LRSLKANMVDFLDQLAKDAERTLKEGYYNVQPSESYTNVSLKARIEGCRGNSVIAEVKRASPSLGSIRENIDPSVIAHAMEAGGASGISVLTEPKHFRGRLEYLREIRDATELPLLMKDIIISSEQIKVAANLGANVVLLIKAIYDRGYGHVGLDSMVDEAHALGIEVLLETHDIKEFTEALRTEADLVGINNRDLRTLEVNLGATQSILEDHRRGETPIVSESGIRTSGDLLFLRGCGAQAFLIGSVIMASGDVKEAVRGFVTA